MAFKAPRRHSQIHSGNVCKLEIAQRNELHGGEDANGVRKSFPLLCAKQDQRSKWQTNTARCGASWTRQLNGSCVQPLLPAGFQSYSIRHTRCCAHMLKWMPRVRFDLSADWCVYELAPLLLALLFLHLFIVIMWLAGFLIEVKLVSKWIAYLVWRRETCVVQTRLRVRRWGKWICKWSRGEVRENRTENGSHHRHHLYSTLGASWELPINQNLIKALLVELQ